MTQRSNRHGGAPAATWTAWSNKYRRGRLARPRRPTGRPGATGHNNNNNSNSNNSCVDASGVPAKRRLRRHRQRSRLRRRQAQAPNNDINDNDYEQDKTNDNDNCGPARPPTRGECRTTRRRKARPAGPAFRCGGWNVAGGLQDDVYDGVGSVEQHLLLKMWRTRTSAMALAHVNEASEPNIDERQWIDTDTRTVCRATVISVGPKESTNEALASSSADGVALYLAAQGRRAFVNQGRHWGVVGGTDGLRRTVFADLALTVGKTRLFATYIPSAAKGHDHRHQDAVAELHQAVLDAQKDGFRTIIIGDFNASIRPDHLLAHERGGFMRKDDRTAATVPASERIERLIRQAGLVPAAGITEPAGWRTEPDRHTHGTHFLRATKRWVSIDHVLLPQSMRPRVRSAGVWRSLLTERAVAWAGKTKKKKNNKCGGRPNDDPCDAPLPPSHGGGGDHWSGG